MARALVATTLDLAGVPPGLTAVPVGETSPDGPRLRLDRSGRTRITKVALVGLVPIGRPELTERDWNWILERPTRQWTTVCARFGGNADAVATALARSGVVRWEHQVDELLHLGRPTGWALTETWQATRARRREAWSELWIQAAAHPSAAADARVSAWLERLAATGRLRHVNAPEQALRAALAVLGALPADARCTRQRLATKVLSDSHALDDNTDVGRLTTAALAFLQNKSLTKLSSRGRRALWARVGVESTPLLSRVSVLGLRPQPAGPITMGTAARAEAGIADVLHLTAVAAEPWAVQEGTLVSVCENPSVLDEAAVTLGPHCPPLVCVEGEASDAAIALLRSLTAGGARLRYHGDFGSGGIKIANRIIGSVGAEPWRFRTADHAAALAGLAGRIEELPGLAGRVPVARWDPDLARAISDCGIEIEEEHVLDDLLGDLAL